MKRNGSPALCLAFGLSLLSWPTTPAFALELEPAEYNFGEVEIGTSSTTIVSVVSTSGHDWGSFDHIFCPPPPAGSPDFSISLPGPLPIDIEAMHIGPLTKMGNVLYFKANDNSGPELWRSDGTSAGTYMVRDINPYPFSTWGHIEDITAVGETIFFVADDDIFGLEVWKSDGTEAGTMLVKDVYPGDYSNTRPGNLTAFNGALYFTARSDGTPLIGTDLWRSDGTEEGTTIILDITDPETAVVHSLNVVGDVFYFTATLLGNDELWRSDGTAGGTVRVTEKQFDSISSRPMVRVGGSVFFRAGDESGIELWKTDASGTTLVKDIFPGTSESGFPNSGGPLGLISFNDALFFHADDGVNGRELWTSDGTEAGTYMFKDINPGSGRGVCGWFDFAVVMDGALYFSGNDGTNGCELWKSDGTPEGTFMVEDIRTGPEFSEPTNFHVVDNFLYFVAENSDNDRELWRTDGTGSGTEIVTDIMPGPLAARIGLLSSMDGTLYFTADDGVHGQELWKSNGTESTTTMVTEILPGLGPSLNLEVTYTPSSLGPAETVCGLFGSPHLLLWLSGSGVTVEPPPGEQIAEILEFVEISTDTRTLSGDGAGGSGEGRLNALTNMIEATDDLIEAGMLSEACAQLQDVVNRCDGLSPPPDFVTGTAAPDLADMVGNLIDSLGCE